MKIALVRDGGNIVVVRDYEDIDSKGEICQIVTEMELIKLDLLELYDKFDEEEIKNEI